MRRTHLGIPQRRARFGAGVLMLQDVVRSRWRGEVTVVGEPCLSIRALGHEDGKLALVAPAGVPSRSENNILSFFPLQ